MSRRDNGVTSMNDKIKHLSAEILGKMAIVFDSRPFFDLNTYDLVYMGTKEQFKEAIKILELGAIKYTADSSREEYLIIIKVEAVILKQTD